MRAVEALEQEALEAHPGAVRQRQVERHLDTTLGRVSFRRWRVKSQGQTFCLLDRLLGLPRYSRASPLAKKRASELATRVTYREASALLSEEVGTPLSAQSVHGWVQALGRVAEETELTPPASSAPSREVVVVEWDDTPVRSQQKGERRFSIKLGIGYSQKQRVGPKRWKLADKMIYGGVEEPERFAERFSVRMEQCFGVQRAGVWCW